MGRRAGRLAVLTLLGLAWTSTAHAHVGPPYPIVVDHPAGPYVVSIWADPDIGVGTFFVILTPAPGTTLPAENEVQVCVQPTNGRLPEACYATERQAMRNQVQYNAQVDFDQRDTWRVRVTVNGANGKGEVQTEVESTPPGFGWWDLLFYGFPFLLFGSLWLLVALRRGRGRRAAAGPNAAECSRELDHSDSTR